MDEAKEWAEDEPKDGDEAAAKDAEVVEATFFHSFGHRLSVGFGTGLGLNSPDLAVGLTVRFGLSHDFGLALCFGFGLLAQPRFFDSNFFII